MQDKSFSLRFSSTVPIGRMLYGVECYTQVLTCEILAEDEDGVSVIGKVIGYVVPEYVGDDPLDMFDTADAFNDSVCDLAYSVRDPDTNEFLPELELEPSGSGILAIESVELDEEFRGYDIGLAAMWEVMDILGRDRYVVVLKPHPLNKTTEGLADKEIAIGQQKLAAYWARLGFKPNPVNPEYHYFDPSYSLPPQAEIRERRR